MYYKLKTIYLSHFRLRLLLNLTVTCYFAYIFYLKGFDKYPLYMVVIICKMIGYLVSVSIERMFFSKRHYYYRNMGLGYTTVFGWLLILDITLFLIIFTLAHLWSNYI